MKKSVSKSVISKFKKKKDSNSGFKARRESDPGFKKRKDNNSGFKDISKNKSGFKKRKDSDSGFTELRESNSGFKKKKDNNFGFRDTSENKFGFKKKKDSNSGFEERRGRESGLKKTKDRAFGFRDKSENKFGFKKKQDSDFGFEERRGRESSFRKRNDRSFGFNSKKENKSSFEDTVEGEFSFETKKDSKFSFKEKRDSGFGFKGRIRKPDFDKRKLTTKTQVNKPSKVVSQNIDGEDLMPLNKYLSNAGVCSRRDAVLFIEDGHVHVNNRLIRSPGYKISEKDIVMFKGETLKAEKKIYILLNKPKDYITTLSDEKGRKAVSDIFQDKIKERIFPVGRLDRNTTGLILLTNDGLLAQKLSHPSFEVTKIYSVVLDREIDGQSMLAIRQGFDLEDGFIKPDKIYFIPGKNRKHLIVQIHSGKNRIVRRIFKKVGFNVIKLDRTNYAGLVKKGLKSGSWRLLTGREVLDLKNLGA